MGIVVLRWVTEVGGVVGVCPGLEMRARTLLRWMGLVAPVRLPYKGVHVEGVQKGKITTWSLSSLQRWIELVGWV